MAKILYRNLVNSFKIFNHFKLNTYLNCNFLFSVSQLLYCTLICCRLKKCLLLDLRILFKCMSYEQKAKGLKRLSPLKYIILDMCDRFPTHSHLR